MDADSGGIYFHPLPYFPAIALPRRRVVPEAPARHLHTPTCIQQRQGARPEANASAEPGAGARVAWPPTGKTWTLRRVQDTLLSVQPHWSCPSIESLQLSDYSECLISCQPEGQWKKQRTEERERVDLNTPAAWGVRSARLRCSLRFGRSLVRRSRDSWVRGLKDN